MGTIKMYVCDNCQRNVQEGSAEGWLQIKWDEIEGEMDAYGDRPEESALLCSRKCIVEYFERVTSE